MGFLSQLIEFKNIIITTLYEWKLGMLFTMGNLYLLKCNQNCYLFLLFPSCTWNNSYPQAINLRLRSPMFLWLYKVAIRVTPAEGHSQRLPDGPYFRQPVPFFQPAFDVWLIPNKITIIYLYNYYYVLVYSNRSVSNNILTEMHLNRQVQVLPA